MIAKTSKNKLAILVGLLCAPGAAFADQWQHINLQSTNQTVITVDYLPSSYSSGEAGGILANEVWVNVILPKGSDCNVSVGMILTNFYKSSDVPDGTVESIQARELSWAGLSDRGACCFTTKLNPVSLSEGHIGYGYNFRQDLSVSVRDTWLQDPISGKNSFEMDMAW
jgi:hypothetical protein